MASAPYSALTDGNLEFFQRLTQEERMKNAAFAKRRAHHVAHENNSYPSIKELYWVNVGAANGNEEDLAELQGPRFSKWPNFRLNSLEDGSLELAIAMQRKIDKPKKVGKWLDKAINKGNTTALLEKFHHLVHEGEREEALMFLQRAIDAGVASAWTEKGYMVWNGEIDQTELCQPDYRLVASLFIEGAERGCIHAQFAMGELYILGDPDFEIVSNHDEAVKWFHQVIQNMDLSPKAIHTKILAEFQLMELAKKQKNPQAQWIMGVVIRNGLSNNYRDEDHTVLAMSYFKEAADQGHEQAKHDLDTLLLQSECKPSA
jgi:hypothetical protein